MSKDESFDQTGKQARTESLYPLLDGSCFLGGWLASALLALFRL